MAKPAFSLPRPDQRTAVIGRTGSGKSQLGAWLLSESYFNDIPYVVVDYKGDALLNEIPRVKEIGYNEIPKHPGVYIIHPIIHHVDEMEGFLWRLWERENIGVFVDEAYMLPDKGAYRALLTQGRSKHIPMINLSQRPVEVNRFVFSEADHFSVFTLNDERDYKTIRGFTRLDFSKDLPKYWSRWYDVSENGAFVLRPVPSRDTILQRFEDRLKVNKRFI